MQLQDFLREWRLDNPEDTVFQNGEEFPWSDSSYVRVRCPFCKETPLLGPDKAHHAHVHNNWFKCQRCGTKGGLSRLLGRDLPKEESQAKWKTHVVTIGEKRPPKAIVDLFGGPAAKSSPGTTIWLGDLPTTHPGWRYLLEKEKFTEREIREILQNFPIHYCVEGRPFTQNEHTTTTGRLIFTIIEAGQQIGWQARWLPPSWPPSPKDMEDEAKTIRYITSPGLKKSFTLYNIEGALLWDTILVVEGAKKVWKTGQFACATFGIGNDTEAPEGLSQENTQRFWLNRLVNASKEGREIWFLYDKDGIGKALLHADAINQKGGNASVIPLEAGKPPDVDDYFRAEHIQLLLKRKGRLPKRLPLPKQ